MTEIQIHRFCVAPMMDGTDRHCRYFHRLMTRHARLYTEMIVAEAAVFGDRERHLGFDDCEHPLALQLGGSDPAMMARAAEASVAFGYDEVNLNVGCPSDRVKAGTFGACLMQTPQIVADCIAAMKAVVDVPVTVKCRIGVDNQDPEESLSNLIELAVAAGCTTFIVHARKAWLQGLSPKENREIPPLDYGLVARMKARWPALTIVLNGGIGTINEARGHLDTFDGVMLGRAAYGTPGILRDVDRVMFGSKNSPPVLGEIVQAMDSYTRRHVEQGGSAHHVVRHMIGLMHGRPGARGWRRRLTEQGTKTPANILQLAWNEIQKERADATAPAL
ncbi:MAG: tRNA dihydrouridine(20/20a) synthase DusA [Pseudomonadota bacterium]